MPRPLTRAQQMENAAFLRHLRRTGNASAAARALGVSLGRFNWRRAQHPAFALRWDAAMAIAHAALHDKRPGPRSSLMGEPHIRRTCGGHLQLQRAQAGMVDHASRQRFLAALSATANVSLSAAAAGHSMTSFYRHRHRDPGFAREWLLALEMGYERLNMALMASWQVDSAADDDWRHNTPPEMPPMTVAQALHLMQLHQKAVVLGSKPLTGRLRPGETSEARSALLALLYEARQEREALKYRIAEADRLERGEPTYHRWEPGDLPDLSQVTGWSQASGQPGDAPGRAWFGGWRLENIPAGRRKGG